MSFPCDTFNEPDKQEKWEIVMWKNVDEIWVRKKSPATHRKFQTFLTRQQASSTVDEVNNRDYRIEEVRLGSYANWPLNFMEPTKMAAAGFYYTGEGDNVRCFECKVEICQWLDGDDPISDHQRWQHECRFIRNLPCGNVSMGVNPNAVQQQPRPRNLDVCDPYYTEFRPDSVPDCQTTTTEFSLPSTDKLGSLGIGRPKRPAHPEYASYDARLRTFETWLKSVSQTKECLADAGFYYTSKDDQTLCYHCGGGLKDWEPNDDPWEQHAKWFSKCYYLLMVKGQAYINSITGQSMAPHSNEKTLQTNLTSFIKTVQPNVSAEINKDREAEKTCGAGTSTQKSSGTNGSTNFIEASKMLLERQEQNANESSNEVGTSSTQSINKPIDDARMCKICYVEELGVVFLPCGHIVACVKCAPCMTTCALCRRSVSMTVRAFFS